MVTILTVVHVIVCLFLILVVLLQAGKGGGMGIAFGGAGSQTVFGSSGAGNFLTRLTSITAAMFLLTSLALAHFSSRQDSKRLQQLAAEKAAEKKSEDEKAAKLKADMEKMRATSAASKDGGASHQSSPSLETAPPGAMPEKLNAPGAPNAPRSPNQPLQLKMPGDAAKPGARAPGTPSSSDSAAANTADVAPKPVVRLKRTTVRAPASDSAPAAGMPAAAPASAAPATAPLPAAAPPPAAPAAPTPAAPAP